MREILLTTILLPCFAPALPANDVHGDAIAVGAIRWDAWYGPRDRVGRAVHATLAPSKWHGRLPFYVEILDDKSVQIDGSSQEIVDREIRYAAEAGLDYWAFVTYPSDSHLSLALDRYLASQHRSKLHFCLITECGRWHAPAFSRRVEALIKEPGYLTGPDGRPVLFLGFISDSALQAFDDGPAGFRRVLDEFRSRLRGQGIPSPYLVIMDADPQQGLRWIKEFGGDALSAYAVNSGPSSLTYRELAAMAERFWDGCAATGASVVPTVTTGWDRRPRVERPVFWERWQEPGVGLDRYAQAGQPVEIADHLDRAVAWVRRKPDVATAQLILIYAWNEFDEGGWLAPTLAEGDARLRAIRRVLAPAPASQPTAPAH